MVLKPIDRKRDKEENERSPRFLGRTVPEICDLKVRLFSDVSKTGCFRDVETCLMYRCTEGVIIYGCLPQRGPARHWNFTSHRLGECPMRGREGVGRGGSGKFWPLTMVLWPTLRISHVTSLPPQDICTSSMSQHPENNRFLTHLKKVEL